MKRIKYISALYLSAILLWACDPNGLEINKTNETLTPPALNTMQMVDVSQANYDDNIDITFSWKAADFGYSAAVDYALYMQKSNGENICVASNINSTSYTIDCKSLYNRLVGESYLALYKGQTHSVKCFVSATVGTNFKVINSDLQTIDFKVARISTGINMLYIVGEFNNNHPDRDGIEEVSPGSKIYQGLINMKKSGLTKSKIKFVEYTYSTNDNGDSWGGMCTNNTTAKLGGDISIGGPEMEVDAELAFFNVNLNTGKCSYEPIAKIGLTGGNWGWGTPGTGTEMTYNEETRSWSCSVEFTSGTFRVCMIPTVVANWNNWSYTFGPKTINELTLKDGAELKLYHNDIAKKFLGGDANFKINKTGKYVFTIYYESADATWRFRANSIK